MSGKHAKDGQHHSGQISTSATSGDHGKHRADDTAPNYGLRTPAEQAAHIEQIREGKK